MFVASWILHVRVEVDPNISDSLILCLRLEPSIESFRPGAKYVCKFFLNTNKLLLTVNLQLIIGK